MARCSSRPPASSDSRSLTARAWPAPSARSSRSSRSSGAAGCRASSPRPSCAKALPTRWGSARAPGAARQLGLVVTNARDDRLHPELATRAATRHLLALHETYDDWALALAAYVAGEGRVDRALRARRGATFWQLSDEHRLPDTARNFVPHVFALIRIAAPEACEPAGSSLTVEPARV